MQYVRLLEQKAAHVVHTGAIKINHVVMQILLHFVKYYTYHNFYSIYTRNLQVLPQMQNLMATESY